MRLRRFHLALITAAALAVTAGGAHSAEPLRIRVGWVSTSLIPMLFATEGVTKNNGTSYVLEPMTFSGSPAQITALATGDLDIATLGFSTFSLAVENAGLDDLRVIADEIRDGADGYFSIPFMVGKDSPIRTVEDLKGKVIATNGLGGGVNIVMQTVLRKHGLLDKKDYTSIEVQFPNMKAVLADRKADLVALTLPFAEDPELSRIGRVLFTQHDAFDGPAELSFWTARTGFLAKNRPAVLDLLEDMIRGVRWAQDPVNRRAAIAMYAKFSKQSVEQLEGWLFTKKDWYRNPDGLPDLTALQQNIHAQKELGFIKANIDAEKYADLSIVKEAATRLK